MENSVSDPRQVPAGLSATLGAVEALGALFSMIDPEAWDSAARPSPQQVAQLFWLVGSRLEETRDELAAAGPRH